jgi:hypothetical protein
MYQTFPRVSLGNLNAVYIFMNYVAPKSHVGDLRLFSNANICFCSWESLSPLHFFSWNDLNIGFNAVGIAYLVTSHALGLINQEYTSIYICTGDTCELGTKLIVEYRISFKLKIPLFQ